MSRFIPISPSFSIRIPICPRSPPCVNCELCQETVGPARAAARLSTGLTAQTCALGLQGPAWFHLLPSRCTAGSLALRGGTAIRQLSSGQCLFSYSQDSVRTDPEPHLFLHFDPSSFLFSLADLKVTQASVAFLLLPAGAQIPAPPPQALPCSLGPRRFTGHLPMPGSLLGHEGLVVNKTSLPCLR